MRYIKNFELFEAVIIPSKIEDNALVNSFESAVEFGQRNDFDVVGYDEFYDSLGEANKKEAPSRIGVPFFALFHPIRKKPMFVLTDENVPRFIPNFKEIMLDIIGHERVHAEQSRRKGSVDYKLPSPLNKKDYFSNKEEIMAFSFTIANELSKVVRNATEGMEKLQRGIRGPGGQLWYDIKKYCDEKTIKRYTKYIYMYLDKIFDKEVSKKNSSINNDKVDLSKSLSDVKNFVDQGFKDHHLYDEVTQRINRISNSLKDKESSIVSKPVDKFNQTKYETPEDLEKIGFKKMSKDERMNIIMDIIDNSPSPIKFIDYFSPDDIRSIKDIISNRKS